MRRLAIILLALCAVVGASAPHCFHYHHHTKSTLDKWADWRTHHPNWKPSITAEEICTIPLIPDEPLQLIPDAPEMGLVGEPFGELIPPLNYPAPPMSEMITEYARPMYAPTDETPTAPTPEPSTLILFGSGLVGLVVLWRRS